MQASFSSEHLNSGIARLVTYRQLTTDKKGEKMLFFKICSNSEKEFLKHLCSLSQIETVCPL